MAVTRTLTLYGCLGIAYQSNQLGTCLRCSIISSHNNDKKNNKNKEEHQRRTITAIVVVTAVKKAPNAFQQQQSVDPVLVDDARTSCRRAQLCAKHTFAHRGSTTTLTTNTGGKSKNSGKLLKKICVEDIKPGSWLKVIASCEGLRVRCSCRGTRICATCKCCACVCIIKQMCAFVYNCTCYFHICIQVGFYGYYDN